MRILMLQSFLPGQSKGGVGYQVAGLASVLSRRGHEVSVYSFGPGLPGMNFQVQVPRMGKRLLASRGGRLLAGPLAFASLRCGGCDVVHAHGDSQLLHRRAVPVVRTFYGSALQEARHAEHWRRKLSQYGLFVCERLARRTATCTTGISHNTQDAVGGLDAIIPCGVDTDLFRPGSKSQQPSVLFVGTIGGRKRGHQIVDAFLGTIRPRLQDCELWLVADRQVDGPGICNFEAPSEQELAQLYRRAWVLVHPSTYEGFGVPYIEAMASGTPIVSSDNCGARELLGPDGPGVIVPDDQLGQEVVRLLEDPRRRGAMGRAGRDASARFDWQVVAARYEGAYEVARSRTAGRSSVGMAVAGTLKRIPRWVGDALPPRFGMGLRAWKNRGHLSGLHAPARCLMEWVPKGTVALDIGANRGLYAHWIAKQAMTVHAFEPNPRVYAYLEKAAGPKVVAHKVALSDVSGTATLWVPVTDGEASLARPHGQADARPVRVERRRLDDYRLHDVGFAKIDVEGHEWEVLQGGIETFRRCLPTLFIEVEERHRAGAVAKLAELAEELGYARGYFMLNGQLRDLQDFDLEKHQTSLLPDVSSPAYVSNFLFPGRLAATGLPE